MAKRYWLKLHQNFLDSNEIAILEGESDGHKYIILWLKILLLCLGKDEDECGFLRLNDNIPYSPKMLSSITKVNESVVESGIKRFVALGMLEVLDDGTYYIEQVQKMIGSESDSAERVRNHRERKALHCNIKKLESNPIRKEKEEEKEKDKEKDTTKEVNQEVIDLTQFLYDQILYHVSPPRFKNNPPDLNKWQIHIDRLINKDNQSINDIKRVIEWTVKDSFWSKNILSADKLRKQYDRLYLESTLGSKPDKIKDNVNRFAKMKKEFNEVVK